MDTNKNKYFGLLGKFLSKNASSEEEALLRDWEEESVENQAFVKDVKQAWDLSENYADEIPVNVDAAWNKFESKLFETQKSTSSEAKVKKLFNWKQMVAALLVGVITVGSWFFLDSGNVVLAQVQTEEGEKREIRLPDGSKVLLNENSRLSYDEAFDNRIVYLEGEAFFDVTKQKGKKFEIIANKTKTTVLGTSFNVRAYAKSNTEVAVLTGKVLVAELKNSSNKVELLPNESTVFNIKTKKLKKEKVSIDNSIAWKTEELNFDSAQLKEVIKTLERYFDIEIGSPNKKTLNCRFTGKFSKPELNQIVETMAFSLDLEIKKENKKYILIGQGCE